MTGNSAPVPPGPHGCTGVKISSSPLFGDSCRYTCACGTTVEADVWPDGDFISLDAPHDHFHKARAAHAQALSTLCGAINADEVAAVEDSGASIEWQAAWVTSQRRDDA